MKNISCILIRTMECAFYTIVFWLVIYLLGSFNFLSFNVAQWPDNGRFAMTMLGLIAIFASIAVICARG